MPGGAPGANEIGGDYRFAVAWLKRVQSAKPDGNGQSEGHHPKAEVLGRDEVSKGAARRGHGCSSAESLAGSGRGCVCWRYDVREPRLPEALATTMPAAALPVNPFEISLSRPFARND